MGRPLLLDLFCGAGGAAMGYHRAGFDVVGVDIAPHPDYPFELIVDDALVALERLTRTHRGALPFEAIHASPPCPHYSVSTSATGTRDDHPDLIPPVREALNRTGLPWVIENVVGAPMPGAVLICAQAMGMRHIARHRLFESNLLLMSPGCACDNQPKVSIYGHSGQDRRKEPTWNEERQRYVWPHVSADEARELLGVPWMRRREDVSDAIPPAYTEFIGAQLIDQLEAAA